MSQRSILSASIQSNFPDNTTAFITPARLRDEQGLFEQYSVLNEQTASIIAQAVASASVGGGSVSTASFNAYTASTNTFTGSIQTQVNALQAATSSYVTNAQTSSFVKNSQTSSMSVASASFATTASYAANANFNTGSLATTGSNTFNGTNTFTGSLNAESASITFLTVGTIVSSSTIFSSGSNTLGDAANDVQTLWGTVNLPTGPLQVTGSVSSTGGFTGSLQGSASFADSATSASYAATASFVSGISGMNLGANTFTGSQTIASSSLYIFPTGSTPLYVTESAAKGNLIFGNITPASSGSVNVTGSANILLSPSAVFTVAGAGLNGNRNIIAVIPQYSGSVPSVNGIINLGNYIASGSGTGTNGISSTFANGGITVTNTSPNGGTTISTSNINATTAIRHAASGSTAANGNLTISTSNFGGSLLISTTGSSTAAKSINQSMFIGTANTASMEAASNSNLAGVGVIGSGLIVSGTMGANSISGSTFVGQFNELTATYAPADPSLVKFAVGTGTTAAARRTSFQVFGTGEVVIQAAGGGIQSRGWTQFSQSAAQICSATVNAGTTVGAFNGSFVTNGGSIAGGNASITTAIIAGELNTITAGRSSIVVGATSNTLNTQAGSDSNNAIVGSNSSIISGSNSFFTGIYSSTGSIITGSRHSAIIAGGIGTRLNNTTGSVALGRDTAYTGTANYTLFTQNVNISGSVTVNGNKQYNVGAFSSTASQSGSANVSQSVTYDTTDISSGVSIVSGSQITIANAGTYNIQFSAQIDRISGSGTDTVYIWLKKNGVNVSQSAGAVTVSGAAAAAKVIAAWNYVVDAVANDNYELVWQSADVNIHLTAATASGNIPAIPSIIVTVTQVR